MTRAFAKVAILLAVSALPLLSSALVGDPGATRCATDGVVPGPLLRIRAESDGAAHVFCSVACAERWLAIFPGETSRLRVADEATGDEIGVDRAWFVRSGVPTLRASGERIHVFASREAAEGHASTHGGRLLTGESRPFRTGGRP